MLLCLALHRTRLVLASWFILVLVLGVWRTTSWDHQNDRFTTLIGRTVTLRGTIADDPTTTDKGQMSYKLGGLKRVDEPASQTAATLPGTITVYSDNTQLQRGYQLEITGKVKAGYGNALVSMSYPQAQVLARDQGSLERWRQRFFAGMRTALPEPVSSFGLGLLVGIRALIPKDMQKELALVGLSHLVAVSGYNLTIIVRAVERSLSRFGRGITLITSLWLIAGFLIVTGASASIVRASLVSVLSLLAAFYGRQFAPLALIMLTAAATAVYNPGYLTDLGWLLSYLAFFGVLILAPAIETRLGHPKLIIVRLFIESAAAQLLTLPLILYFFGELSIVAPITNLIILPMVPLAMATSFVAGIAGSIMPVWCGWVAWPAMLLLGFMTKLIDAFAALPWAGTTTSLSLPAMLIAYAVIVVLIIVLNQTNRRAGRPQKAPHARRRLTELAVT
jgi:competence protein ComEC